MKTKLHIEQLEYLGEFEIDLRDSLFPVNRKINRIGILTFDAICVDQKRQCPLYYALGFKLTRNFHSPSYCSSSIDRKCNTTRSTPFDSLALMGKIGRPFDTAKRDSY